VLEAAWSSTFDPSTGTPGTALVHGVVNNQIYSVFRITLETTYIHLAYGSRCQQECPYIPLSSEA
jgi:hypothetical protein